MPAYLLFQYLLFCVAGLLTVQFLKGGLRDYLGHVLLHTAAAGTVLVAIALGWHNPLALALQALLVLGPYGVAFSFQRAIQRAVNRSEFDRALELSHQRLALFPFKMYRRQVRLFEGLAQARAKARELAREPGQVLSEIARQPGLEPLYEYSVVAELSQKASERDWSGIVTMFDRGLKLPKGIYEVAARILLVRAYCELGALEPALARLEALEHHKRWRTIRSQLHIAWLAALSTGGRRQAVDELLNHQLRNMPRPVAASWRARAAWAAGAPLEARALISPMLEVEGLPEPLRHVLEERLAQIKAAPPPKSGAIERALDRLERLARTDHLLFQSVRRSIVARPVVGWLMIAILAVFTGTTVLGDPAGSIADLGAMGLMMRTEPWRLFTGMFIHDGWLHLFVDGIALIVAGSVVEGVYRGRATLALFLFCGVTAGLTSMALAPQALLVGTQGAVLGWLGALGAIFVRARDLIPGPWRTLMLKSVALILLLEVLVTLTSGHISALSIGVGLVVGFIGGMALPQHGLDAICRGEPLEEGYQA